MTLAQSIARVAALVAGKALSAPDENALTAVSLQCTGDAYSSALVAALLVEVAAAVAASEAAVAAVEADAAFGDLATETTDALDDLEAAIVSLEASAAACVTSPGGV